MKLMALKFNKLSFLLGRYSIWLELRSQIAQVELLKSDRLYAKYSMQNAINKELCAL